MHPSLGLVLARLHMSRGRKQNSPPEKPNPMDKNLSALWDLVMHINGRVDRLYALIVGASFTLGLGVIAILVTVLVK